MQILDTARALLAEAGSDEEAAETLLASAMEVTRRRAGLLGVFDPQGELRTLARNRMEVPIDVLLQEHRRSGPHLLPDGRTEDPSASCLVTPMGPEGQGIIMLEDPVPGAPPPRDALAIAHALAGLLWSHLAHRDPPETRTAPGPQALLLASPRLIAHRRRLDLAAREQHCVLLVGEPGNQTEDLARWFHACGPTPGSPFASLRPTVEAPEADHAKAVDAALHRATGGTLFIDGPDRLPVRLQQQLVEATGSGGRVRTLVCASSRHLADLAQQGEVSADLVALLTTRLVVPPLRGHAEDIAALVDLILRELPPSPGGGRPSVTDRALQRLEQHAWPGNVDELRTVLGMAACRAGRGVIAPRHLPVDIRKGTRRAALRTLADVEREHIARVLAGVRTKREASQVLGIAPSTLYEKLRRHGLSG